MTARAIRDADPTGRPPAPASAQPMVDATSLALAAALPSGQAMIAAKTITRPPALDLIRTLGRLLDDLERARIQQTNRIKALERERGEALPHLYALLDPIQQAEHLAELELVRAWRNHPLAPWAKNIKGIGEKTIARLIAEIGTPHLRPVGHIETGEDDEGRKIRRFVVDSYEPRTVSQLRQFCGVGDPARKRRKGMTQEEAFALGNPAAKKRCWIFGEAFFKVSGGPYRAAYEDARARYADRVHAEACVRCGPAGKPAAPGSPWSGKHQHEAAKRYAVKVFLKDLWLASRQRTLVDHAGFAGGHYPDGHPEKGASRQGSNGAQERTAGDPPQTDNHRILASRQKVADDHIPDAGGSS